MSEKQCSPTLLSQLLAYEADTGAEPVAWRWREHYNAGREDRWHLVDTIPKFSYDVEVQSLYASQVSEPQPSGVKAHLLRVLTELQHEGLCRDRDIEPVADRILSALKPVEVDEAMVERATHAYEKAMWDNGAISPRTTYMRAALQAAIGGR